MKYFILILLFIFSCKKPEKCPTPKGKYLQTVFKFQLIESGTSIDNTGCGLIIEAELDSGGSNLFFFKPVVIPTNMYPGITITYKGELEILPEKFTCVDGRPDPVPGKPLQKELLHFVNIKKWEKL